MNQRQQADLIESFQNVIASPKALIRYGIKFQGVVDAQKRRIQSLLEEIEATGEVIAAHKEAVSSRQAVIDALQEKVAALEEPGAAKDDLIDKLKNMVAVTQKASSQFESELNSFKPSSN